MAESDPAQQRVGGVRQVIEVLQGFRVGRADGREVRIGAVSFDYNSSLLAPLTSVTEPGLPSLLKASTQGGTDLAEALCSAWVVATRTMPPVESGCAVPDAVVAGAQTASAPAGPERRLVVLVTDGSPAPDGAPLVLDGTPPARACASAGSGTDGDAYLCALGDTWSVLNATAEVELIVIGLDERDEWFVQTQPYWQRVVGCGDRGEPPCDDMVVRSIDAQGLADLILRLFPLIDVCPNLAGETFTCEVPGGLRSVGFQFSGVDPQTRTRLDDGSGALDSSGRPPELRPSDTAHVWIIDAPRGGEWRAESNGPTTQRLFIQFEPAEFDADAVTWSDALELRLTAVADLHVPSAEKQQYYLEIREDGVPVDNATVHLESLGGREFSLTAPIARLDSEGRQYEALLYLPLAPMHEVARVRIDGVEPPPLECEVAALWQHNGVAPQHELGVRLGLPLLRFRVPAEWSVTFDGTNCDGRTFAVHAGVNGCEGCSDDSEGPLPLTLSFRAPSGGGPAEREISWYDPSTGREEFGHDQVDMRDSLLVRTEPIWASALYLLLAGLFLAGVSAWSVNQRQRLCDGEEVAPVDLGLEHRGWPHPLVRGRVFVYRPVPADLEGQGPRRVVMLRYFIAGPLVVRGGEATGQADGRSWWQGRPICESGLRPQRLRPQTADYSPF